MGLGFLRGEVEGLGDGGVVARVDIGGGDGVWYWTVSGLSLNMIKMRLRAPVTNTWLAKTIRSCVVDCVEQENGAPGVVRVKTETLCQFRLSLLPLTWWTV